jgi:small-conductance mechanosensitive channel
MRIPMRLRCLLTVLMFAFALLAEGQQAPAVRRHTVLVAEPATLRFWNRPIVTLHAQIDELAPSRRVENALRRVDALSETALGGEVGVGHSHIDNLDGLPITIDTQVVFTLLAEDIDPESGLTLEQLGAATAERLREALRSRAEQNSLPKLLLGIGSSIAATLAGLIALWLIVRVRRAGLARLEQRFARRLLGLREVDLSMYWIALQRGLTRLIAFALIATAAYLWLTFVLVQFPYTQPWGASLGTLLRHELSTLGDAALGALPGLGAVLVIFVLTRACGRVVSSFFQRAETGQIQVSWLEPESARATRRIAVALLWLFAVIVAYPYIPGSSSDAFKGVSVFAGLMLTLGSSGMVNQLMSGFVLVYSHALKPGDFVRVGEIEGTVTSVGVLSTKLATQKREEVTLPNSVVVSSGVTNYTRLAHGQGLAISTIVTIGYDAPWRQVHALLVLAADKIPGVRANPAPLVLQRALSDFYVEYELRLYIDAPEQRMRVLSELHAQLQDAFNEHGVQIMSPHFESQPGERVLVPRERWHAAPAAAPAAAHTDGITAPTA